MESGAGGGLILSAISGLHDARWVIVFALLVFGANLVASQMRGDSIVYAAVSKNLAESGDLMRLELNDEPYFNKPPLYFWITAGVMTIAGTGPVGAKLGALLISTALCVLLYRSVRRIFDDRMAGMLAVFVFAATYVVYRNTYHARMESLVTLCIFASIMCFWRWLDTAKLGWMLGWGFCAGLAVLTKGPLGLLPIAAGIVYLLVRERGVFGAASAAHLLLGLIVFFSTCSWWFFTQGADFAAVFFGEQLLDRSVLGPAEEAHRWWSVYWAKLLSYDLIWMVTAVLGAREAWRHEKMRRPVGLLLTAAVLHLILIHLVEQKTARYLYQFYIFTAGLSAFGILSLKRFDAEHLLKIVIVVFAIGLQFTGTSRSHDYFAPMRQAVKFGEESGLPLVGHAQDFETLDEQAAFDYYLAGYVTEPIAPVSFVAILPRSNPIPYARSLFTSDRVWVGLVLGGTEGPGEIFPMTDSSKGSP